MNCEPSQTKKLIASYLEALSGRPKTAAMIETFVADRELVKHIQEIEAAFPEYELICEQMIAEGDLVMARCLFRGVHRGAFAGIEATGKTVSAGLMIVYRIADGRIAEHWMQFDSLGLLRQLGPGMVATAA